jgi:hypothetical protein
MQGATVAAIRPVQPSPTERPRADRESLGRASKRQHGSGEPGARSSFRRQGGFLTVVYKGGHALELEFCQGDGHTLKALTSRRARPRIEQASLVS